MFSKLRTSTKFDSRPVFASIIFSYGYLMGLFLILFFVIACIKYICANTCLMKTFVAFSMGLLLLNFQAKSQEYVEANDGKFPIPTSSTEIIIQPLSVVGGGFELGFDQKFNLNNGFRFIFGLYGTENPTAYNDATSFSGYKFDAHYKLIIDNRSNRTGYSEYYIGLFSTYRAISLTQNEFIDSPTGTTQREKTYDGSAASFGVIIGIKSTLVKKLNVDIYGGIGYIQRLGKREDADQVHIPVVNPYQRGPMLKFGIAIGYLAYQKVSAPKN